MPKPRDVILAAVGPPRRHVAALGRVAPFLAERDAKVRAAACKIVVEILDDYGGGNNPLPLVDKLLPPLVELARTGDEGALAPLADFTWVLWRARAYAELAVPAKLLAEQCEAALDERCFAADARKGLGKSPTRAREAWMYRRMLFESALLRGEDSARTEAKLRAAAPLFPGRFLLAPPYVGAEGDVDDGVTYSMLGVVSGLRALATGKDPCSFKKRPSLEQPVATTRKRGEDLLARVVTLVEPRLAEMRSRPRKASVDDGAAWRADAWAEQALYAELAGDGRTARARMKAAFDFYSTYGGFGRYTYGEDAKRLGVSDDA